MVQPTTGPFARLLASQRDRFNARFFAAKRYNPRLDPAAFAEHLRSAVAPIVEAVSAVAPVRTDIVGETLYDLSLTLVSEELLGPNSRYPHIVEGWKALLPRLARFVAQEPGRVVGAVTNALYNLSLTPGARPHDWAACLIQLADVCPEAATLLKAGQVAAWRAGMAHYRAGALELCRALDPTVARAALGLPDTGMPADVSFVVGRLLADPWLNPIEALEKPAAERELRTVARVGAFRGFGGLFIAPPTVSQSDGLFYVTDGQGEWLLSADAFGATFSRVEGIPADSASFAAPFRVESDGTVTHGAQSQTFREFENVLSWAANEHTLAVTSLYSHAVYLVALAAGDTSSHG